MRGQKRPVGGIVFRHEADVLAFTGQGHGQTSSGYQGHASGLVLVRQGKEGMAQARGGHQAEKITLIFGPVVRGGQNRRRVLLPVAPRQQAGVMAGSKLVRAQSQGRVQQGSEFDGPVAARAGIGRAPFGIGPGKGNHDLALKNGAQIHCVQGNVQGPAGGFKARQWITGAAGPGMGLFRQKEAVQGQHIVPGPAQKQQGAEAVHAAAHGYGNAHGQSPGAVPRAFRP